MKTSKSAASRFSSGLIAVLVVFVVLACFFGKVFLPDWVLFSNDGPLGLQMANWLKLPQAFLGQWYDLAPLGTNSGASLPDVSTMIRWVLGPIGYAKFLTPISLWFLGGAAYFCFRRMGLAVGTAIIGGLAACLTTGFFTNACWGAAPPIIAFGMNFLAIGALAKRDKYPFWIAPALAGLAVGINVMEAADIGALFSLLIAAFVVYQSLAGEEGVFTARVMRGVGRTALVAGFAGFIGAYAVSSLIGSNISGIAGGGGQDRDKGERWDWATSWSMPKRETLALVVPNLYGCSVVTPGAANYWGGLGRDPGWDRYFASKEKESPPAAGHFIRHTGRGIYLGILVVLIGLWATLQSFRGKDSAFTVVERRLIWFWVALAFVSLLLAFGRFAIFYQVVYRLPYFSTIRNPDKFLHFVTFASVILFGYGIHGLHRRYLSVPLVSAPGGRLKTWWRKADAFDRRWLVGCIGVIFLAIVGWVIYGAMRGQVDNYLADLQRVDALRYGTVYDAQSMERIHDFTSAQVAYSLQQVGWFVLFLIVGIVLVILIMAGTFGGRRATLACFLLGAVVVSDLGRANFPYIIFWNYKEKYEAGNPEPVIKFLASKPYDRVAYLWPQPFMTPQQFGRFQQLYNIEWTQQLFPFYNIQTLDIVQMPRMAVDLQTYVGTMQPSLHGDEQGHAQVDQSTLFRIGRNWQLASTRYLVGPLPLFSLVNQEFDTVSNRFRIVQPFDLAQRPDAPQYEQAVPSNDPNAPYALIEYTGALPRAGLFSNWEVNTNSSELLQKLASREFDPAKTVLVSTPIPAAKPTGTNQGVVPATIASYEPADIKLDVSPATPSVLMMCDKIDPDWQVWVDGKRSELLRCNYLMKGVYLEAGHHQVEFKFRADIRMFYVNIAAIFVGIGLLGYAVVASRKNSED